MVCEVPSALHVLIELPSQEVAFGSQTSGRHEPALHIPALPQSFSSSKPLPSALQCAVWFPWQASLPGAQTLGAQLSETPSQCVPLAHVSETVLVLPSAEH
jgi:hypothetical protein